MITEHRQALTCWKPPQIFLAGTEKARKKSWRFWYITFRSVLPSCREYWKPGKRKLTNHNSRKEVMICATFIFSSRQFCALCFSAAAPQTAREIQPNTSGKKRAKSRSLRKSCVHRQMGQGRFFQNCLADKNPNRMRRERFFRRRFPFSLHALDFPTRQCYNFCVNFAKNDEVFL